MGKGSSGTKTTYTQSPEQAQMYRALLPLIQGLSERGVAQLGQPDWNMPLAPTMPSMQSALSNTGNPLMPDKDWFSSLSPEVMSGVWAPYEDAANKLNERIGSTGQLGNARGGISGNAAAGLGEFYSGAGRDFGLQAWNMTQPGRQAEYNAFSTDYANQVAQMQADYGMQQQAWGMPFGMTGMMPGTYSQGITTQPQSTNWMGMLGGAATGGLIGSQTGGGGYANTGMGALGGAMMGGK